MMEKKGIRISREKAINALFAELDENRGNGHWRIDIEPARFEAYETKIINVEPHFSQAGNYYPPEAGHICELGIEEFFDWEGDLTMDDFDWNYFRQEVEKEYRREHGIEPDEDFDGLAASIQGEIIEARQTAVDEAARHTREKCEAALVSRINCIDAAGTVLHSYCINREDSDGA